MINYTNLTLALCMCDLEGLGLETVREWLENDIVGCLQQFFMNCQTGDFLKDPEIAEYKIVARGVNWNVQSIIIVCFDHRSEIFGRFCRASIEPMLGTGLLME